MASFGEDVMQIYNGRVPELISTAILAAVGLVSGYDSSNTGGASRSY
jgi:hypothetical protein